VTRRDGSTGVEAGILRQLVDGFGGVLFDITRPLMEAVGLGAVAREEVGILGLIHFTCPFVPRSPLQHLSLT
jgi:hypothetical protein